ncbi:succinate dehydrogenase, cytochrome b556 subunit [Aquella oligotrophica]|uniref:Succinate dehydrogenase cytochrome b556 subunit n=1 Tax=Aquella oligotrophica TaxID=2067065 RepID=A0A2I7N8A5_9NEIS|nr:succinate dehydrogenase, cytochrome b556 subunit [Aquella oligotrophica]AUR52686.1 succinate dehydrogenase, cytochrome b556 subunit [Aquella oligotrophica]
MEQQQRPKYLDLPKLGSKMSITAKVSILHRASGVLMFLAIPFVLYLFHKSLTSAEFYSSSYNVATCAFMKVVYIVLIWAIMHHMCAGVRFLFLDMHKGIEKGTAQKTARWVMVVSLLLTVFLGVLIW